MGVWVRGNGSITFLELDVFEFWPHIATTTTGGLMPVTHRDGRFCRAPCARRDNRWMLYWSTCLCEISNQWLNIYSGNIMTLMASGNMLRNEAGYQRWNIQQFSDKLLFFNSLNNYHFKFNVFDYRAAQNILSTASLCPWKPGRRQTQCCWGFFKSCL